MINKTLFICLLILLPLYTSFYAQNVISEEVLFMDDDTVLLETNKRAFYANKLVDAHVEYPYYSGSEAESIGEGNYRVMNMLPAEFDDLYVYAKLTGIDDTILVDKFDLIKAFTSTIVELPFVAEDKEFQTKQGESLLITDSESKFESLWPECEDSIFQKIRSIRQTTHYKFTQQNLNNSSWGELTPQIARHFTTSLANVMYSWSQPFFEELLDNYSGILYNDKARFVCLNVGDSLIKVDTWSSKNKNIAWTDEVIVYDSTLYTQIYTYETVEKLKIKGTTDSLLSIYPNAISVDKFVIINECIDPVEDLLKPILSDKRIQFCPTGAVDGLGGGASFGLRGTHFANAKYEKSKSAPTPFKGNTTGVVDTWAHEYAHCIGFSHTSNTTYGDLSGSWTDLACIAYDVLSTDNDVIPAIMYNDSLPRTVTESLPFLYNIYIQEIAYTDSILLGEANCELNTITSIDISNDNYNVDAELIIDTIVCPEWISYDGDYPIAIASGDTLTIPLTVSISNTSDTVAIYNEPVVVKGENTLNIPVTVTVSPDLPTGVDDDKAEMSVFPNPSDGVITTSSAYDNLEVYDLSGKVVYAQSFDALTVDFSSLPRGLYLVKIMKSGKSYMNKIVIE